MLGAIEYAGQGVKRLFGWPWAANRKNEPDPCQPVLAWAIVAWRSAVPALPSPSDFAAATSDGCGLGLDLHEILTFPRCFETKPATIAFVS